MKRTIEERLRKSLSKNPITRDRLFLKILKPSIEKCVGILLQKNKRRTRLHDVEDLIQEANITILKVIQNKNMDNVRYELRTYLLGAVKRRVWGIVKRESAIKRQAQNRAYSLDKLITLQRIPQGINLLNRENINKLSDEYGFKDAIVKILEKLKSPAKEIFQALVDGYKIADAAELLKIPQPTIYTILRRKIRPIAKKVMGFE